jgi:hypothetical protein
MMGTRSLTVVFENDTPLVVLYRQFDGYLAGHGTELGAFLKDKKMANGLGVDTTNVVNGMGDLAAQLVAHFKIEPGGFYLMEPKLGVDHWQEYEYHVYDNRIIVYEGQWEENAKPFFDGTWQEFAGLYSTSAAE